MAAPAPVDLRSDTVTRPTHAMWEAMRAAELGDDVLGDEPTVALLEARIARELGKEAAVFVPSGTMANQLAIRAVCGAGDEIVAHADSTTNIPKPPGAWTHATLIPLAAHLPLGIDSQ